MIHFQPVASSRILGTTPYISSVGQLHWIGTWSGWSRKNGPITVKEKEPNGKEIMNTPDIQNRHDCPITSTIDLFDFVSDYEFPIHTCFPPSLFHIRSPKSSMPACDPIPATRRARFVTPSWPPPPPSTQLRLANDSFSFSRFPSFLCCFFPLLRPRPPCQVATDRKLDLFSSHPQTGRTSASSSQSNGNGRAGIACYWKSFPKLHFFFFFFLGLEGFHGYTQFEPGQRRYRGGDREPVGVGLIGNFGNRDGG